MGDRNGQLNVWLQGIADLRESARRRPERLAEEVDSVLAVLTDTVEDMLVVEENLVLQQEQLAHAEAVLWKQHSRYTQLFDLLPDGYLMTDSRGVILKVNQPAAKMLRVAPGRLAGVAVTTFIVDEDGKVFADLSERLRFAGRVDDREAMLRRRGGAPLPVSLSVAAFPDPDSESVAWHWLLRDITDRKQNQEAQRRNSRILALLHQLDRAILEMRRPADTVQTAVDGLRRLVGCSQVALVLFDRSHQEAEWVAVSSIDAGMDLSGVRMPLGEYPIPAEHLAGEPILYAHLAGVAKSNHLAKLLLGSGQRSCLSVPIVSNGEAIGNLNLSQSTDDGFGREGADLARQFASSLAVALENQRLLDEVQKQRSELQNLSRRLVEVQEEERRMVVRQLHDDTNQMLAMLLLDLGKIDRSAGLPDEARRQLTDLRELADGVVTGLHNLAVNLRPASLDRLGLVPALEQYVEVFQQEHGLPVTFVPVGMEGRRFRPAVETALFRIVQEALSNTARHAEARHVSVVVEPRATHSPNGTTGGAGEAVLVIVEDDGVGFDLEEMMTRGAPGLVGMRERAEMLGGRLTVESGEGTGTTVYAEVPL